MRQSSTLHHPLVAIVVVVVVVVVSSPRSVPRDSLKLINYT